MKENERSIFPGSVLSCRLPDDTPEKVIQRLNDHKQNEKSFSKKLASIIIEAIEGDLDDGEQVTLKIPGELSPEQRNWLSNPMTKQMIGKWIYQMVNDGGALLSLPQLSQDQNQAQDQDESVQYEKKSEKEVPEDPSEGFQVSNYHNRLAGSLFKDD